MTARFVLLSLVAFLNASEALKAQATVRCNIDGGWCWAPIPAPGDAACYCPGANGWIKGTVAG